MGSGNLPTPIAIIGMSCRLPGGADTPDKLWDLLAAGRQAWKDVPPDRWRWQSFYNPNPEARDAHNSRGGCFVDGDIAAFDASFFRIPKTEAEAMDPQHRLLLELVYEALESAGILVESIHGSDTGVFTAIAGRDYDRMAYKDTMDLAKYNLVGCGDPVLCGRISYVFNLHGPSFSVDTGCSGGMVCLHQACLSLRSGESDMAIVGSTNLLLGPDVTMSMSQLHMVNDDGRCYTFDSRGEGYGRAEGVATLILKRLDDAIAAGDRVRAVIRNSGIAHEGKTNGIMLPSSFAQQRLIRKLYDTAAIDPLNIGYIEAHGTGTAAGDTTEIDALNSVFCCGSETSKPQSIDPVFVGSIKANLGHSEATAGLAGLIKVVLMLERGLVPPVPGIKKFKEGLGFDAPLKVARKLETWPRTKKAMASINCFGYGGTIGHCIVEAAVSANFTDSPKRSLTGKNHVPAQPSGGQKINFQRDSHIEQSGFAALESSTSTTETAVLAGVEKKKSSPRLFIISAKSEKSLKAYLCELRKWIISRDGVFSFPDLAYTLCVRRSLMLWRCSIVASEETGLVSALDNENLHYGKSAAQTQLVFLYSGQGTQWHAMGRELIHTHSAFARSIAESDRLLRDFNSRWSLLEELQRNEADTNVNNPEISQPTTTAIQIALTDLLRELDVIPDAVLGHSSGEISAAYASGCLSHETALYASYQRGLVSSKDTVAGKGAMLAVGLGEADALAQIADIDNVSVACVNSPESVTVSGDKASVDKLKSKLDDASIFNRKLQVNTAYHSYHMKAIAGDYLQTLKEIEDQPVQGARFFSSVTGKAKTAGFGASYWVGNLTSKVRFGDALKQLAKQSLSQHANMCRTVFVELGPHGALAAPVRQTLSLFESGGLQYTYLSSLSRDMNALETCLHMVGKLFEEGLRVNLKPICALYEPRQCSVIKNLVPYAWDHSKTYWNESRLSKEHRLRKYAPDELLGSKVTATGAYESSWRNIIALDNVPWLQEHIIDNFALTTGTVFLCMAIKALSQTMFVGQDISCVDEFLIRNIVYSKGLVIPSAPGKIEIQLALRPSDGRVGGNCTSWQDFRVSSVSAEGSWNEHCSGSIRAVLKTDFKEVEGSREVERDADTAREKWEAMRSSCNEALTSENFYNGLLRNGVNYGPHFSTLEEIRLGDCKATGVVTIPDTPGYMPADYQQPYVIHPVTLDALMHIVLPLYSRHCSKGAVMLTSLEEVSISTNIIRQPGDRLMVACNLIPAGPRVGIADWSMYQMDENSELKPVINVLHGIFRGIGEEGNIASTSRPMSALFEKRWGPDADYPKKKTLESSQVNTENSLHISLEKWHLMDQLATTYIQKCASQLTSDAQSSSVPGNVEIPHWMEQYVKNTTWQKQLESHSTLENKVRDLGTEGKTLSRLGSNLHMVVTRGAFTEKATAWSETARQLYLQTESSRTCISRMTCYINELIFKKPYGMKILEIEADGGDALRHLLHAATKREPSAGQTFPKAHFTSTSQSAHQSTRARPKFGQLDDAVTFKILDIKQDPDKQGFEETYDLVVGVGVLSTKEHPLEALANVRKLLQVGGRILLVEPTKRTAIYDLLLSAVNGGRISDLADQVCAPQSLLAAWDQMLRSACFSGIDFVEHDHDDDAQAMSMMLSRAIAENVESQFSKTDTSVSILSQSSDDSLSVLKDHLRTELSSKGANCIFKSLSECEDSCGPIAVVLDNQAELLDCRMPGSLLPWIRTMTAHSDVLIWVSMPRRSCTSAEVSVADLGSLVRWKNARLRFITVDVQNIEESSYASLAQTLSRLLEDALDKINSNELEESEYRYVNEQLLIPRLTESLELQKRIQTAGSCSCTIIDAFQQPERPLQLHIQTPGLLNNLIFVDDEDAKQALGPNEIEVKPLAFGVNQTDLDVALGCAKPLTTMIGEFAGVVHAAGNEASKAFHRDDRVFGWTSEPYASRIKIEEAMVQHLPNSLTFAEGASVLFPMVLAYQALIETARLQSSQAVLIHSAASPVGQAAVMIAQNMAAEIFATVSSRAEAHILKNKYYISDIRIFSSKAQNFKRSILQQTKNKGVNVVLGSPTQESFIESWGCVAELGIYVEVEDPGNQSLPIGQFDKKATYSPVDLSLIRRRTPGHLHKVLSKVSTMLASGQLRPVGPIIEMSLSEISAAFQKAKTGNCVGKLVLSAENAIVPMRPEKIPQIGLHAAATYIIAGNKMSINESILEFMASRNARCVILVLPNNVDEESKARFLRRTLSTPQVQVLLWEYSGESHLKDILQQNRKLLATCKGFVHTSAVGTYLSKITSQADQTDPWIADATNQITLLNIIVEALPLDFCIMISSIMGNLDEVSQMGLIAECSFKKAFAKSKSKIGVSFASLLVQNLETVEPTKHDEIQELKTGQDSLAMVTNEEFFGILDYCMQQPGKAGIECSQIFVGLQRPSLQQNQHLFKEPLYSHIPQIKEQQASKDTRSASSPTKQALQAAETTEEVQHIILGASKSKIASLVTIDQEEINPDAPLSSFGFDSLIAIDFKNWINRTLDAPMQTNEILESPNIMNLVELIACRSALVRIDSKSGHSASFETSRCEEDISCDVEANDRDVKDQDIHFPKLPLPTLDSFLSQYLESLRGVLSREEFRRNMQAVDDFQKTGGIGLALQGRLAALEADPDIVNWQTESYNREWYLERRYPLIPFSNFFYTHPLATREHTQAQRAALITLTAFEHMKQIEAGELEQQYLNEQPLCMDLFQWIFNSSRTPHVRCDHMNRFPGNDYIVALRRGHAFKIELRKDSSDQLFARLCGVFEAILDSVGEDIEWAGVLTTDHRDNWAKVREELESVSKKNEEYLSIMERSAFIICLDDAAPANPSERARQVHFGDGSNRWNDNTIQFVVCSNGVSGMNGGHAMLDATTIMPLNTLMKSAIEEYTVSEEQQPRANLGSVDFKRFMLDVPSSIQNEIGRVRKQFDRNIAGVEHAFWTFDNFGGDFFRAHKCAPRSAFQIVIQLAAQDFYGYLPYCWETVSVNYFDQGRVDLAPITWSSVVDFCTAIFAGTSSTGELQRLFHKACKAHANGVSLASRGFGIDRHFEALRYMLREGEPVPSLFSDPVQLRVRRHDFHSSCFESDMLEKGYVLGGEERDIERRELWLHYEVYHNRVKFNITAPKDRTETFSNMIRKAAELVRSFLEAEV